MASPEHQNVLKVVQNAMENLELYNVWRIFNSNGKRFIWRQRQPDKNLFQI